MVSVNTKGNTRPKRSFDVARTVSIVMTLGIVAGLATLTPIVFTSVMTFVFKMKVLPIAEYDSLTAELETTKQKLTDVTAIEEKEKKEAAANFEAFSQAKGQKTAAQEKIAELEAKIKVMEEHMAQAKELAASSITKMDDGLRKRDMTPGAAKEEPAAAATAPAENAEKPAAAAANKGG